MLDKLCSVMNNNGAVALVFNVNESEYLLSEISLNRNT